MIGKQDKNLQTRHLSRNGHSSPRLRLNIVIHPLKTARRLVLLVSVLVCVGTVANVIIYKVAPSPEHKLAKVMHRFDLGFEPSIPNWYSSIALLACSLLLTTIGLANKRVNARYSFHWFALAFLFMFLALDEAVMIHEMADATLHDWLNTSGILYFAWVIPGAVFTLCAGLYFFKFLLELESRTRRLFVIAGAIFVGGAIGAELIAGVIVDGQGIEGGFTSLQLTFEQTLEELMEMMAIVLFLYALMGHIERHVGTICLSLSSDDNSGNVR